MKSKNLILLWVVLGLSACSNSEHEEIRQWMNEQTKSLKVSVPPLPEIKPIAVVDYDAINLADPFSSVRLDPTKKTGGGKRPDTNRRREPLEAFPLESLRMVGMLYMEKKPVALVKADKSIYQVRVGNYLGQNFGVVVNINENGIALKELVEDANGDWVERMTTMQLQEQEQETKK